MSLLTTIKKHKFASFFIFILFVAIAILIFLPEKKQEPTTTTPAEGAQWQKLIPGKSTKEDLINILGDPIKSTEENGRDILEFKSTSSVINHKAYLENGTAIFLDEIVTLEDNVSLEELRKQYGVSNDILYGDDAYNGYYLFVYPDKGVAYLGNPSNDVVLEIWYFTPMTFEKFNQTWAPDYKTTLSPNF